jgi:hypothetical protein
MVRIRTIVLNKCCAFLVLLSAMAPNAVADEQRCKSLGVNCVCSEPFNTNKLERNSWAYNPADSVTKECATGGIAGGALERNTSDVFGSNQANVLSALPSGHQISYFVRAADRHLGIFYGGHSYTGGQFVKRLAARWYIYHSPDFEFAGDGACENSKLAVFGYYSLLDKSFGSVHMYNFTMWSPAQDCCFDGPGPQNVTKQDWRGKWWRVEAVLVNRAGGNPGLVAKVYMKNVTDNAPEIVVVDTSYPGTQLIASLTRTPPKPLDQILMNNYRQNSCNGFLGVSHYMMAGWDADAGQRIGAASEIEGAGGAKPPVAPTNLRIAGNP